MVSNWDELLKTDSEMLERATTAVCERESEKKNSLHALLRVSAIAGE